jgi:cytochrome o ubiquinol oxidase subunit 1
MMTFVLGGFTGILLAFPPLDYLVHNTLFLVAHFHNMLIPGMLYGMLAAYHYWFPKAFGFRLNEKWGRISVGCWVIGFYLAFMPLYVLGAAGVARRTQGMFDPIFRPWLYVAGAGALILLAALGALFVQLLVSIRERDANRVFAGDPWDGRGLEWSTSAPPPDYNFAVIPRVHGRDPFFDGKRRGEPYAPPEYYDDIELPKNSMTGPVIGVVGAATAFGLVWHMWWLAVIGMLAIIATVIARSFARDVHRIIPAAEIERIEGRWLRAVAEAAPIMREVEMTSVNQGLAKVSG